MNDVFFNSFKKFGEPILAQPKLICHAFKSLPEQETQSLILWKSVRPFSDEEIFMYFISYASIIINRQGC